MIYYPDASALVKAYCYEKGTEIVVNFLNTRHPFYSSVVVYSEVLFALRRKLENREMNQYNFSEQVKSFENHFHALINCVELNKTIFNLSGGRFLCVFA